MEKLPNYDRWKLAAPPQEEVKTKPQTPPIPLPIGEVVSFWWKHTRLKRFVTVFGRVYKIGDEGVWIDFLGRKTYYSFDDMRGEEK